jgi:UMF1 family MFS transporter
MEGVVRNSRGQFAWALFDWAISPWSVLIITFVFPAYFAQAIVGDQVEGQATWGYAVALGGLAVAVLSVPLGAIADAVGRRKPWILAFSALGIVASIALWFAVPGRGSIPLVLFTVSAGNIGIAFGAMFANTMLPDIASHERLGRLSGWAWGLGYLGGLVALGVALVVFVQPASPLFGLDKNKAEHVRVVGPLVALWLGLFVWPLLFFTPDRPDRGLAIGAAFGAGLRNLGRTLGDLKRDREMLLFLLANMLYADGLVTLFALGGVYVSGTFGMSLSEVIVFGVVLNVAAGIGAFFFGWIDDRIGSRPTAVIALCGLILASIAAVSVQTRFWLWVTACFVGVFVGPVQSASRALMARRAPPERQAEYFGLLALSGRATAFAGPAVVAAVTEATNSQRLGLATIIGFLLAGLVLLLLSGRYAKSQGPGRGL